jgi:hypothetical protein
MVLMRSRAAPIDRGTIMLRNPAFGFALLALATLGSLAMAAGVQPARPAAEADVSDRIPEHIHKLFAAGIVSLENLGF